MKRLSRLFKSQPKSSHAAPLTSLETIPSAPQDMIRGELQHWMDQNDTPLAPLQGMCWPHEGLEGVHKTGGLVALWFHGGGYIVGSALDERSGFANIPKGLVKHNICSAVLGVEYTLAKGGTVGDPSRTKFPVQLVEALSAYHYIVRTRGIPAKRVLLVGDSAGGNLVLVLLRYLQVTQCMDLPAAAALLSPWCDMSDKSPTFVELFLGKLPADFLQTEWLSPALHPAPSRLPPVLVHSGTDEIFTEPIAKLVERLTEAEIEVTSMETEGLIGRYAHDFLIYDAVHKMWPEKVDDFWTRLREWALRRIPE